MNASALLTAQGWRGKGHSLHKTDDAVGLSKPLLLNRKDNTKGIGATQHFTSDQWWMNAFDEQLQGLDTTKKGQVVQTVSTGKLNAIEKGSLGKYSLYTTFVRGGFLEGTLDALRKAEATDDSTSDDSDSEAEKKKTKAKPAKEAKETKEERRARKEAKRKRKEAKTQRREAKAARRLLRKSKKSSSSSSDSSDADEEKRRRRARKEEKRRRRKEQEGK